MTLPVEIITGVLGAFWALICALCGFILNDLRVKIAKIDKTTSELSGAVNALSKTMFETCVINKAFEEQTTQTLEEIKAEVDVIAAAQAADRDELEKQRKRIDAIEGKLKLDRNGKK